jgi:hypothetical protein
VGETVKVYGELLMPEMVVLVVPLLYTTVHGKSPVRAMLRLAEKVLQMAVVPDSTAVGNCLFRKMESVFPLV